MPFSKSNNQRSNNVGPYNRACWFNRVTKQLKGICDVFINMKLSKSNVGANIVRPKNTFKMM